MMLKNSSFETGRGEVRELRWINGLRIEFRKCLKWGTCLGKRCCLSVNLGLPEIRTGPSKKIFENGVNSY